MTTQSPKRRASAWNASLAPAFAFTAATDEILPDLPEESGGRLLFVLLGAAIVGLYLLLRRTRERAAESYWESRRREQELRDADPDMRRD